MRCRYSLGDHNSEDPQAWLSLASRDVVAVVINYRLGIFGFLAGEEVKRNGVLNAGEFISVRGDQPTDDIRSPRPAIRLTMGSKIRQHIRRGPQPGNNLGAVCRCWLSPTPRTRK